MITSLTPHQQSQIQVYLDNALAIGLSTERLNQQEAIRCINEIHELIKAPNKPIIKFYDSPLQCQLARQEAAKDPNNSQLYSQLSSQLDSQLNSQLSSQLHSQLDSQLDSQLNSQLHSQLSSQLYSQLGSQLYSQLRSQLSSQLDSQLNSQLYSQLRSQLYSQLGSQLYSQLRSQLYSQLSSQLYSQLYSQLDSQLNSQLYSQLRSQLPTVFNSNYWSPNYWSGYYNFYYYIRNELFPERIKEFSLLDTVIEWIKQLHYVENLGYYYFISERPTSIVMEDGKLHCTKGPSIEYADGFSIYSIKGKVATEEQKKTIIHNKKFNRVIEDMLND